MFIDRKVYDIIGIGIGPFNLGLAALCDELPQLQCIFFDQNPAFNWHPGMMLPNARLQVPFYADLVTIVNPCSRFTYLNFLKERKRLFRFAILENNFILRKEYNEYCQWVIAQLDNLYFHQKVVDVHYEKALECYAVMVHNLSSDTLQFYYTRHLVIGVGSIPSMPKAALDYTSNSKNYSREIKNSGPTMVHSSQYLFHKERILQNTHGDVTIIGSGQSAAEIFYDLLQHSESLKGLNWFTRSERFYQMDYSKFALEMTSPGYIDYFYSLSAQKKKEVLAGQACLYKGINFSLIDAIYQLLYEKSYTQGCGNVYLQPNAELNHVKMEGERLQITFHHNALDKNFTHVTDAIILATGYTPNIPEFLQSVKERLVLSSSLITTETVVENEDLNFDARGNCANDECVFSNSVFHVHKNYSIDIHASEIFVQNAELHTHGFTAPDLGMGPYRNATILNTILGYERFEMEMNVTFQRFDLGIS